MMDYIRILGMMIQLLAILNLLALIGLAYVVFEKKAEFEKTCVEPLQKMIDDLGNDSMQAQGIATADKWLEQMNTSDYMRK